MTATVDVHTEWATRTRGDVIQKRSDRLDAENSARLDKTLQIVSRTVSTWK